MEEELADPTEEDSPSETDSEAQEDWISELLVRMQHAAVLQEDEAHAEEGEAPLDTTGLEQEQDRPPVEECLNVAVLPDAETDQLLQGEDVAVDRGAEGAEGARADEAAIPMPEPGPAAAEERPPREKADLVVDLPGGKITYYPKKDIMVATCSHPGHGSCVLTRSCLAGRRRAQGRPAGFLAAWLAVGQDLTSKQQHWDKAHWPSRDLRQRHRELLGEDPTGALLLDQERGLEPGEEGEPDLIP